MSEWHQLRKEKAVQTAVGAPVRVAVASGKGGTGKTTVAVSLTLVLRPRLGVQLLDLDVEEPNAHLLLRPRLEHSSDATVPVPEVDPERCRRCGRCGEVCAYGAIGVFGQAVLVFPELCHGCGGCSLLCPSGAIAERPRKVGTVEWGEGFAHGRLEPGEALAPPVGRAVLDRQDPKADLILIDAPPGTSCPVVEAVRGADFCLLVTEPTPFGLHDLELAAEMTRCLGLRAGVIINREDTGDTKWAERVRGLCAEAGLEVLAGLPHDRAVAEAYARGRPAARVSAVWRRRFEVLAERVLRAAGVEPRGEVTGHGEDDSTRAGRRERQGRHG